MAQGVREKKIKYIEFLQVKSQFYFCFDISLCFVVTFEVKKFSIAGLTKVGKKFEIRVKLNIPVHVHVALIRSSQDYARAFCKAGKKISLN